MKTPLLLAAVGAALTACQGDETVRAYGAADKVWQLTEINGAVFPAEATLKFSEEGQITGNAPCNSYFAQMTAPYPWFEVKQIAATKRACPNLMHEVAFFQALRSATLSEVSGPILVLSTPEGLSMVFKAVD